MKKLLTLCIIHQEPKVLLGIKKRGFGEGRWNGFGGKVNQNEDIETAAKRELFEEAGIEARNLEKIGILHFQWEKKPEILEVHIFKVREFQGEPVESEEMTPKWFDAQEIPFHAMWPDDEYWMPMFLETRKFRGRFLFDKTDSILRHSLQEVDYV